MRTCTPEDEEYPTLLKEIPDLPPTLWLEGSFPPEGAKYLAVVGSRALSSYGRSACEALISGLKGYPASIVSGLALGADACAHRAALRAGLHTIAVPGSGLTPKALYPRAHVPLAREILESGGLLMSEHEPEYKAFPHDFPSRNRIMVGMAHAVLMIEAGARSGSLITARLAGEYNRHLLCVPHRISDTHGFGAETFVREGATLVSTASHILEALGIQESDPSKSVSPASLSVQERLVYDLLEHTYSRDEIFRATNLPIHHVLSVLGTLEIQGFITEIDGKWRRL